MRRGFVIATVLLVAALMVGGLVLGAYMTAQAVSSRKSEDERYNPRMYNYGPLRGATEAMTSARGMATVEVSTGRVLYTHNADAKLAMASTTKVLTAIAVIENVKDIDEPVKVHPKAIGIEGTSIYLQKDETLTVRELLLGLMLRSGNDAAQALAFHVGGSALAFAEIMNDTAKKAGATNSNFKNPHGLDEKEHYTTALDLALISAYAMRNPIFAEIVATKDAKISGVDYPRVLQNKNRLLRSNKNIVGVKTGFTSKAGRCFVGAMEKNGMTVVNVVLNCGPMFPESEAMMTRALGEFYMHKVLSKDEIITPTYGGKNQRRALVANDFYYPIRPTELAQLEIIINEHDVVVLFGNKLVHQTQYIEVDN